MPDHKVVQVAVDTAIKITEYINNSINQSIKMVHFNNKRPELQNIIIKNLSLA